MALVHVCVADARTRRHIVDTLRAQQHEVVEQPTGFHVLQAIADVIDGAPGAGLRMPDLLVIDAVARGCAGRTIAAGLRELGVAIPVVLVGDGGYLSLRRSDAQSDVSTISIG